MEKTIEISGKKVRLKTSGAFPLRYKAQFHRDYFKDLVRLMPLADVAEKEELSPEDLEKIDFDMFYNIIWTMAKTANPSIPEPFEWLDQFESFPIVEIIPEIQDMLVAMISTEKNLQAAGQGNK